MRIWDYIVGSFLIPAVDFQWRKLFIADKIFKKRVTNIVYCCKFGTQYTYSITKYYHCWT